MAGFELPWWRSTGGGSRGYLDEQRTTSYMAWAYGKMVFASAGGYDSVWGEGTIDRGHYIDPDAYDEATDGPDKPRLASPAGVYARVPVKDKDGTGTIVKYRPKAHLVSLTTSGIDNLGMTQKGSYTYRTYTYSLGKLPAIGGKASMSWGWAYGGKALGGESFSGKVIGYNISTNGEGGFDVTVEMLGNTASTAVATIRADAGSPLITSSGTTDAAGNQKSVADIFSAFGECQNKAVNMGPGAASWDNGLTGCVIEVPDDYGQSKDTPTTENPTKQKKAFVTFQSIVDFINTKLLAQYCPEIKIIIDADAEPPGSADKELYSANPLEMLVPGRSSYGGKNGNFTTGAGTGIPGLHISVDFLKKCGEPVIQEPSGNDGPSRRLSIKSFFDNIFRMIQDNLGGASSLTLANSADPNDKNIYIVDFNNLSKVGAHPVGEVRSANLSCKLDGDQAAIFYIEKNAPNGVKMYSIGEDPGAPQLSYDAAKAAVGDSADAQNVSAMRGINNAKAFGKLANATNYGTAAPWDLSVTVDGSSGWQYGGVITHESVGAAQALVGKGYTVGFAITNITHNVSENDWTTSLSTYCRIFRT